MQITHHNIKNYYQTPPEAPEKHYLLPHPPTFTREDVRIIIQQIIKKGARYLQFRKELGNQDAVLLEQRLVDSTYMQFIVRKELTQMGDDRRIGTALRGFSRLLLGEFQQRCWNMIELETALLFKSFEETLQRQKLQSLLPPS